VRCVSLVVALCLFSWPAEAGNSVEGNLEVARLCVSVTERIRELSSLVTSEFRAIAKEKHFAAMDTRKKEFKLFEIAAGPAARARLFNEEKTLWQFVSDVGFNLFVYYNNDGESGSPKASEIGAAGIKLAEELAEDCKSDYDGKN